LIAKNISPAVWIKQNTSLVQHPIVICYFIINQVIYLLMCVKTRAMKIKQSDTSQTRHEHTIWFLWFNLIVPKLRVAITAVAIFINSVLSRLSRQIKTKICHSQRRRNWVTLKCVGIMNQKIILIEMIRIQTEGQQFKNEINIKFYVFCFNHSNLKSINILKLKGNLVKVYFTRPTSYFTLLI
jgi:hypothetical protein